MKTFAERLKAERKRLKMTQAEADLVLSCGKGQVAAWEIARNVPHELTQEAAIARLKKLPTPKQS
jgi:DNA-binding transcriptional regulator YiaG